MSRNLMLLSLGALAVGGLSMRASAQELVTNGGFETGDFTGWTGFGDTVFNGVDGFDPHSGSFMGFFGPITTGGIQQTLTATVGSHVHVSFWYTSEGGLTPNSISVTLGSVSVFSISDVTSTTYQQFTGDFVVADANPVLSFTFSDEPDYIDLDDVSVTLTSPGNPCGSADFNCDGDSATDADIEAFFACLAGTCPPPPCTSTADFNGDGDSATDADIEAFFRVLAGGTC
jgi:hypothetical protein